MGFRCGKCHFDAHVIPVCPFLWFGICFIIGLFGLIVSATWVHLTGILTGVVNMILAIAFVLADTKAEIIREDRYDMDGKDESDDENNGYVVLPKLKRSKAEKIARGVTLFLQALLVLLTVVFALIHFTGQAADPEVRSFPNTCPKLTNCYRFAPGETDIEPIVWNTDLRTARTELQNVINPLAKLEYESLIFFHYRFLTPFFGFPDDVFFVLNNTRPNVINIWIQSQSRLGKGDLGANEERVTFLIQELRAVQFP